jgi:DNA invertase Pin-like site-specific DNA recombinase
MISQRTKSALAAAKARGVELGKYGKTVLAARNQAVKRAWDLRPILAELEALGISSTRGVAHALDERGVPTPTGKRWHQTSTVRVLRLARAA